MGVTIKEVAEQAGVSTATVSRVLNGSGAVTAETRRRVEQAIRLLRYRPNVAARSLITSTTSTIGVLLPDLFGEFFSEIIRGVDAEVQRHRRHLLVSSSHDDLRQIEVALSTMAGRVDGLIVMAPRVAADALAASLPRDLPVVLMSCFLGEDVDALVVDNHGGAYQMVRHLGRHGHRHVAFIGGPTGNYDAEERRRGYRAALADAGLGWVAHLEIDADFTEQGGYAAMRQLLECSPRPTAVFAANDAMAIGALQALRDVRVRVPSDVAVAGFDDIPIARYLTPALSSVHVAIYELGVQAVRVLMDAIAAGDQHHPRRHVLPTRLVIRESCGGHVPEAERP